MKKPAVLFHERRSGTENVSNLDIMTKKSIEPAPLPPGWELPDTPGLTAKHTRSEKSVSTAFKRVDTLSPGFDRIKFASCSSLKSQNANHNAILGSTFPRVQSEDQLRWTPKVCHQPHCDLWEPGGKICQESSASLIIQSLAGVYLH